MNYHLKNGEYYFSLQKLRKSNKSFEYCLKDIDIDDYVWLKYTSNFRIIEKYELKKYAGVLFIEKDKFDEDNFNLWQDWIKVNITIKFLEKPFPDYNPFDKIKKIIL